MGKKFDFGGWATKANLLCSDGRVIRENAFEECDGKTVPLIWNHKHDDPEAVLGHALLENRGDGVYAYCTFNDTDAGQNAYDEKLNEYNAYNSSYETPNQTEPIVNDDDMPF